MTEEQLNEWVAALRSGEYKQGKSVLYNREEGAFCCLGVYASLNNLFESFVGNKGSIRVMTGAGAGSLNSSFLDKTTVPKGMQSNLAKMNDQGVSFAHIADYIEERKELFID